MRLERVYKKPEGWEPVRNTFVDAEGKALNALSLDHALRLGVLMKLKDPTKGYGALLNPPPIERVKVVHTGVSREQNFSERLVRAGVAEGFMTLGQGKLILHTVEGQPDLEYKILRAPGWYCCHCGQSLENANAEFAPGVSYGTQHVLTQHPEMESPDRENPSGYERLNGYETALDEAQHEKFNYQAQVAALQGE